MRRLIASAAVVAAILTSSSSAGAATGILEGAFAPPGYSDSAFGGSLCPCEPIPYVNFPGGQTFLDAGAAELDTWITAHAGAGPLLVGAHSEGGQVVYVWIGAHAGDPAPPDVRFVTFGNPYRRYGGVQAATLPADEPYLLTDVARQYDGAADWPADLSNGLAVLNAFAGLLFVHPFYGEVSLDDPRNAVWTEGNITYVLAPTYPLPLLMPIAWLGPQTIAALDASLRPQIEAAYARPFAFPTATTTVTTASTTATSTTATSTTAPTRLTSAAAPAPTATAGARTVKHSPAAPKPKPARRDTVKPTKADPVKPAASTAPAPTGHERGHKHGHGKQATS